MPALPGGYVLPLNRRAKKENGQSYFKAEATVAPRSAGVLTVRMPAAAIASYLSLAVPWPPLMIAPAWSMRRPGGEVWRAVKTKTVLSIFDFIELAGRTSGLQL